MHIEAARGRRAFDASVNIVPYIDMLMTIMTFLVVCAVWTQTATMPVASVATGACASSSCPAEDDALVMHVAAGTLTVGGRTFGAGDAGAAIAFARAQGPGTALRLDVDDGVDLDRVVRVMDKAKAAGFTTESLAGAEQR